VSALQQRENKGSSKKEVSLKYKKLQYATKEHKEYASLE